MDTIAVTCIKNGRTDSFGRPLVSGTYYPAVEINTAEALWVSGYVSVEDPSVFDQDPLAGTSPLDDFNVARALSLTRQPQQTGANLAAELAAMAGTPRRRAMYPRNFLAPTNAPGKTETIGTVTDAGAHPNARTVSCLATSTGSTARIIAAWTMAVETSKFYELSATVDSVSIANYAAMSKHWLSVTTPAEGTQALIMGTTQPVAGQRFAVRFKPAGTSTTCRVGLGCNSGETVTDGDSITFSDIQLCEVDGLAGSAIPFSYRINGTVGATAQLGDTIDSAVLCIGDSWANDTNDYPGVIASTYNREVLVSATGGHTLTQISAALTAFIAAGTTSRFRPNFHIPGVCIVEGGINDIIQDRTADAMFADLLAILAILRARNIVPIVMLPTLATDSSHYTAARANVAARYAAKVYGEVQEVVRSADYCLNADGTAHTTNMLSETSAWIHPSITGHIVISKALDDILRRVGSANHYRALVATW